jgi:hypothetical protein
MVFWRQLSASASGFQWHKFIRVIGQTCSLATYHIGWAKSARNPAYHCYLYISTDKKCTIHFTLVVYLACHSLRARRMEEFNFTTFRFCLIAAKASSQVGNRPARTRQAQRVVVERPRPWAQ